MSVDLVSVLGRLAGAALRSGIGLRLCRERCAPHWEAHPASWAFSHRSYIDFGRGGARPCTTGYRRCTCSAHQPVVRFLMGPLHAALGDYLHPAQSATTHCISTCSCVYGRGREAVQPDGPSKAHPAPERCCRLGLMSYVADAYLDGRSDDYPAAGGLILLRSAARDHRIRRLRGGEDARKVCAGSTTHQGAGGTQLARSTSAQRSRCASTRRTARRADPGSGRETVCVAEEVVRRWPGGFATPVTATGLVSALLLTTRGTVGLTSCTNNAGGLTGLSGTQTIAGFDKYCDRKPPKASAERRTLFNGHPVSSGRQWPPVWYIAPDEHRGVLPNWHAFLRPDRQLAHAKHVKVTGVPRSGPRRCGCGIC